MPRPVNPVDSVPENVVLLSASGERIGTHPKATVHTRDTPLHLAFSCYLFSPDGEVLLTRRALTKAAWPGVWTNSFCGHPGDTEGFEEAITRRAEQELGVRVHSIRPVLPDFRYRATDASGIVENEVCPVFTAILEPAQGPHQLAPEPAEVAEWFWASPDKVRTAVEALPGAFSPWMVEQLDQLPTGIRS